LHVWNQFGIDSLFSITVLRSRKDLTLLFSPFEVVQWDASLS
jgi:hypothetical protein